MKKISKHLLVVIMATAMLVATFVAVTACSGKGVTLSFETYGGTVISDIKGMPGDDVVPPSAPQKEGYNFVGWYLDPEFSGESVRIPTTMPDKSVTYYAKFEINPECARGLVYDINRDDVTKFDPINSSLALPGDTVTVADGDDFNAGGGYLFLGWSTEKDGDLKFSDGKAEGQYNAGESYTVTSETVTLYAQWAKGFKQKNGNDWVYFYEKLFTGGLGGAIRLDDGVRKYGFASIDTDSGYLEFTFMYDDGDVEGRIDLITETEFTYADATKGGFIGVDYATDEPTGIIFFSDGYGRATLSSVIGSVIKTEAYGFYEYNEEYDDYTFMYTDENGEPILVDGKPRILYFTVIDIDDYYENYRGAFMVQGLESGSYLMYDNGELYNVRLDLNGYGYAKLFAYDPIAETTELLAEGKYKGTENYEDYMGEWAFIPTTSGKSEFKFITNMISGGNQNIPVYIEYNPAYDKSFTAADGSGDTFRMDGYGSALYSIGSESYVGYCTVGESGTLVTFVPYVEDGDTVTAGGTMYFDIDFATGEFTVNTTGYIIDGTTLVEYKGTSKIIVVPDTVTAIAANAFNYVHTDVSIMSVVIPASVTSIGACAFENSRTLHRVTFLSETPVAIDWSAANDPFRWPAGDFVIVVPEASVDAYRAAWSDCPHAIKGSVEVTVLPEFEIKDGVLVRYNKQDGAPDEMDITIPDEVTEIAAGVFRGLEFVKSVNFNNVTKIGDGAFEFCSALKSATFTNVQIIGDGAFAGSGLAGTVELPEIVEIGESAFAACTGLRLVRMGENLSEIGGFAFSECQVQAGEDALVIELEGLSAPLMGEKIAVGNISFRIAVKNIIVAKRCYEASSWTAYCRHLLIPSGEEKGMYMFGTHTLDIDGRAVFDGSTVYLYEIVGENITLYLFDEETKTFAETTGTYKNSVITVTLAGEQYAFKKAGETETYVSVDGLYTLVCDPRALLPDYYENYTGYTEVTFNGSTVQLYINGYNTKQVIAFRDTDGKLYDFAITFDGDKFTYTKKSSNTYVRNITCTDGSVINLHFTGNSIYIFGELKIDVGGGVTMPTWSDYSQIATETENNVYTFTRKYQETVYTITVAVSSDNKTFTYSYAKA